MKYVDLVAVTFDNSDKKYLFRAPAWSHLKKGDIVRVDTALGIKNATVVGSATFSKDLEEEEARLVITLCGAVLPLKTVVAKVEYHAFVYEDETNAD